MNYFIESLCNIAVHLIVLPCPTLHRRSYISAFLLWPMKGHPVPPSWQQHTAASATDLQSSHHTLQVRRQLFSDSSHTNPGVPSLSSWFRSEVYPYQNYWDWRWAYWVRGSFKSSHNARQMNPLKKNQGKYVPGRRASPIRWQTLSTDQVVYTPVLIHFCAPSSFPQYPHAENP